LIVVMAAQVGESRALDMSVLMIRAEALGRAGRRRLRAADAPDRTVVA
jgi:hypothetical protein